jgi:hypothetical protein
VSKKDKTIKDLNKKQIEEAGKSSTFNQKISDVSEKINSSAYFLYVFLLIASVASVLYYPYLGFADYDIWYHLKFGEHFVTNKTFQLDHSIFSWTPADPNWKYGIWLGSSFLYLLYSFAGIYGLELFKWFVVLSAAGFYFYYCSKSGDKIDVTNVMLAFLMVVVLNATASLVKPDNFTLIFFTAIVFIYFHTKLYQKKFFYLYPLIFLLWVNTHGGFLVGLFFITLVLSVEVFNYLFYKDYAFPKRLILKFAAVVVLSYLATLINPYGLSYHMYIIPTYFKGEIMGYAGKVFAFSSLWNYIFTDYFKLRDSFIAAMFLAAIFIILAIYLFRRKRFLDIGITLINIVFFYLGSNTSRVIPFFAIVSVFSIAYIIKRADALSFKRSMAAISAAIFLFMAPVIIYDSLTKTTFRSWIPNDANDVLPDKEVAFIKKFKLPGPIFNDYLIGGYLISGLYPEYKVFIDPRYGPYWKETGPDYFNFESNLTEGNLKSFNDKYPFKTAIFHYAASNFIKLFMRSDEWKLIYFDDIAAVFVRKDSVDEISKDAFKEDISPERFKNFSDPVALQAIFTIYANLGAVEYAGQVLDIYEKNVSGIYYQKHYDISGMTAFLSKVRVKTIK